MPYTLVEFTLLCDKDGLVPVDRKDPYQVKLLGKHTLHKVIRKKLLPEGTTFFNKQGEKLSSSERMDTLFKKEGQVSVYAHLPPARTVIQLRSKTVEGKFPRFCVAEGSNTLREACGLGDGVRFSTTEHEHDGKILVKDLTECSYICVEANAAEK